MSGTLEIELNDTPPEQEAPAPARELSPREIKMAEIAQHAQERREQEIADANERMGIEAVAEETPAPDPEPRQPAPEPRQIVSPEPPEPRQSYRQIVLNGQAIAVTEDQFTHLAQMGALAATQPQQPQYAPQPVEQPPPAPRDVPLDRNLLMETTRKMQLGTLEEGMEGLQSLIGHVLKSVPAAPTIDPNAIVEQARQQTRAEAQLMRETEILKQEFPRVFADPRLMGSAQMTVMALAQQDAAYGRVRPTIDIYREAAASVYDMLGAPRPGSNGQPPPVQAAPNVQPRVAVEERKRAAPRNPETVNRRAEIQEAETRYPTNSEYVQQLRRSRGQTVLR